MGSTAPEILVPDLSVDFVSGLFGQKVKSFTIKSGSAPGDGYNSVLYSIECTLEEIDPETGKERIAYGISKNYPSHPARQEFLNKSNTFWMEFSVYNTWIPALKEFQREYYGDNAELPFPRFISGKAINFRTGKENTEMLEKYAGKVFNPFEIYILMADMKKTFGCRIADRTVGLGLEEVTLVMKAYAKIHALSWAYKVKSGIADIGIKFPFFKFELKAEDMSAFENMMLANFQQAHDVLKTIVKPEESGYVDALLRLKENLKELMVAAWSPNQTGELYEKMIRVKVEKSEKLRQEDAVPWQVVVHGDCWINNLLFRYDPKTEKAVEVVLIDLQIMRENCPTSDLTYCLYTNTSPEFREKHLSGMLQLYADEFMRHCDTIGVEYLPGFGHEALKRRFHRAKYMGAFLGVMVLPLMIKESSDTPVDMEKFKKDVDLSEIMVAATGVSPTGKYKERLYGLVKELYDEGVL